MDIQNQQSKLLITVLNAAVAARLLAMDWVRKITKCLVGEGKNVHEGREGQPALRGDPS